jgi:hypothetical protein
MRGRIATTPRLCQLAAKNQSLSLFSLPESSRRIFSRCLKMMIAAIRPAKTWK